MATCESQPTSFSTTRWTLVFAAARGGDTMAVAALGSLFGTYWQPLYRFARRKGKSREDAEDLVQGFLTYLTQTRGLQGIDRAKGRFRSFLLTSFTHWMVNEWRRASREKRGGGAVLLSLDWEGAETGLKLEPADGRSPDYWFDREWALSLLDQVLRTLEAACRAEDCAEQFEAIKPCLSADSARIPYAKLAADLNLTEGALRVAVHRLRKRYRTLLKEEIARTLATPAAVEDEMQALFSILAG